MKTNFLLLSAASLLMSGTGYGQTEQLINGDWESSGSNGLLHHCANTNYSNTSGNTAPWDLYSTFANFSASGTNFARIPARFTNCIDTNNTSLFPAPCPNGHHPNSWDAQCGNQRYIHFRFRSDMGAGRIGVLQAIPEVLAADCAYDFSLFLGAKRAYGNSTTVAAGGELTIYFGNSLPCSTPQSDPNAWVALSHSFTTQLVGSCNMTWTNVTAMGIVPPAGSNTMVVEVKLGELGSNGIYDVYLDDISLVKQEDECGILCCNADCPSDLNCDGITNPDDLFIFNQLVGLTVEQIENPCYQLADLNNDGVVDGLDAAMLSFGPCSSCCSTDCPGDFNCDGSVDMADLDMLMNELGNPVTELEDPCMVIADYDSDGWILMSDNLHFMGYYFGVPCPGGMAQEPGTGMAVANKVTFAEAQVQQNPTTGNFQVEHGLTGSGAVDIMVIDHTGRMVLRSTDGDQFIIPVDISAEPVGTYTAVFHRNGTLSTVQLVKE